jgi:hypothetical protein
MMLYQRHARTLGNLIEIHHLVEDVVPENQVGMDLGLPSRNG